MCVIDANQAGNVDWNPASQQQQSITVYGCVETEAQLRYTGAVGGAYEFCAAGTKIILTTGELVVSSTLSLTGVGGVNAVIDANGTGRVIRSSGNLTLRDVTVTGGNFQGDGGGMRVDAGTVVLNGNSAIDGNVAYAYGGVLLNPNTTLTLNDASTISNNRAHKSIDADRSTGRAGGVYIQAATLIMNGSSTIRKNTAEGNLSSGGGILINMGTVTMNESSAITENSVIGPVGVTDQGQGGGVWATLSTLTLNGSASITRNSATGDGGGIYRPPNANGTVTGVTATNVTNNTPNNCAGRPVDGCVP